MSGQRVPVLNLQPNPNDTDPLRAKIYSITAFTGQLSQTINKDA